MLLTLEQTLADQEDLDSLCADRLLVTEEIFPGNAYYGCDRILKEYSGYSRPLKVVVPHGIGLNDRYVWIAEAKALLPAIFYFNPNKRIACLQKTNKIVLPSASLFLYLIEMLKDHPKPPRKGTIFFPGHSTHYVKAEMDFERIATTLDRLDDEYKPVTVCLYWKDYLLGRHEAFRKKGMRVVSAGHMYDSYFFWRFYHLCSMHCYSATNYYTSAVFYSIKAGCSFFFLESFGYRDEMEEVVRKEVSDAVEWEEALAAELEVVFRIPLPVVTARQMELVDFYVGTAYFKSPEDLYQQLLEVEKCDINLFFVRDSNGNKKFCIPTYYQRKIRYLFFLLERIRNALTNYFQGYRQKLLSFRSLFFRK